MHERIGCKCGMIADASWLQKHLCCDIQGCSFEHWSREHGLIISAWVSIRANTLVLCYTLRPVEHSRGTFTAVRWAVNLCSTLCLWNIALMHTTSRFYALFRHVCAVSRGISCPWILLANTKSLTLPQAMIIFEAQPISPIIKPCRPSEAVRNGMIEVINWLSNRIPRTLVISFVNGEWIP